MIEDAAEVALHAKLESAQAVVARNSVLGSLPSPPSSFLGLRSSRTPGKVDKLM